MKIEMSADGSKQQNEAMEDSASENFSLDETGDHYMVIQELKKEIVSKNTKISSLEIQLKQKEGIISEKDDLIKSFKLSIELISQNKYLQIENTNLKNTLDLTKNLSINKEKGTQNDSSNNQLQEFNELKNKMVKLQSMIQEINNRLVEFEDTSKTQIQKMVDKLVNLNDESKITMQHIDKILKLEDKPTTCEMSNRQNNNETILLNHSKEHHITYVKGTGIAPFTAVFEDIPFAGSGWMVIQRRFDGKVDFNVTDKTRYENGFGDINGDFWIGIETIHQLTTSHRQELYVQLVDFDDVTAYARYDNFCVGDKESNYKLKSLGNYSGNAGDALRAHEKQIFQMLWYTDKSLYFWWSADKHQCDLNGQFSTTKQVLEGVVADGIWWGNWYLGNKRFTLKSCKMLIRPKLCNE
ncbi:angiopoietin-related protein 7-like [Drosophila biarmipes]|uniref:angiopoietin-related protein 7-like n=1 Tax=Drosophila biarmipes TaxID=125945 RepID=UPI0021CCBD6A|nr:angiopoietin-related protein 7-like [Drosophila biarmipes]